MKTSTTFTLLTTGTASSTSTLYLITESDGQIYVPPSGSAIRILGGDAIQPAGEPEYLDGAEIRERTPQRLDGWPTEPGHYIVDGDVARAAEALGLAVPGGHVYTMGPAVPHDVGRTPSYATRRWLTYWPNLTGEVKADDGAADTGMSDKARAMLESILAQIKAAEVNLPPGSGSPAVFALADCRAVLVKALASKAER